jgi:hypothetical protein
MAHAVSESVEDNNLSDSTETLRNNPINNHDGETENWDMHHFREGFSNGTRSAEAYLQKVSHDIFDSLKKRINGLNPMEEEEVQVVDQDRRLS